MIIIVCMMNMLSIPIHTCLIELTNDTDPRILILNKENGALIPLAKYERRRFGDPHTHAYFDIYIQEKNKRVMPLAYTCKQHACNGNSIITLKFSDIKKKNDATQLFTIIQHEPISSMAQQVTESMRCNMCE